jgi:hypothetical protein
VSSADPLRAGNRRNVVRRHVVSVRDPRVVHDAPGHRARAILELGHWEEYDPFLALMEDWFSSGTFGPHPHRGIETVSYVIDGSVSHRDSRDGSGTLGPGDAQWMTAGRGIIHSEEPAGEGPVHALQLWVNLPAAVKLTEPGYQDLRAANVPVRREPGVQVRVFSGSSGTAAAATRNHVPVTMLELHLDAGARLEQELPASYNCFLYLLEGEGRFGDRRTLGRHGQVLWLDRPGVEGESEVAVCADTPLVALLFAGEPLHEPVVAKGPFVMNTPQQIAEAYADFRAGRFAE